MASKFSLSSNGEHRAIPVSSTSHPDNPVPEEPRVRSLSITAMSFDGSSPSQQTESSTDSDTPTTPLTPLEETQPDVQDRRKSSDDSANGRQRRASTVLISQNSEDMRRVLESVGTAGTQKVQPLCCGGGCCRSQPLTKIARPVSGVEVVSPPDNEAFKQLNLNINYLTLDSELTNIVPLPEKTVSFSPVPASAVDMKLGSADHPPTFVQPHPPYNVYAAPLYHARELTKPGAEKRTFHFDIDVTDYPAESGNVDFVVGGAIGVCPRNKEEEIEDIFNMLGIPKSIRDKKVTLHTTKGRWPTIWGDDQARDLITTRRELLSWCSDIQSYPPTKPLFRLLAEYASEPNEKKILMFLSSAQGQGAFCDLRTGSYITVSQLLHAFPSSQPPLDYLLSVLNTLMPRFYSLSQDPLISCQREGSECRKLVEIAVSVAETDDWKGGFRTGVGSGYLERLARQVIEAEQKGLDPRSLNLHLPMFRGLMANPLAKRFASDGPMLLIGAGVGIAPFRGFVQRRLQSANCANKVWVLQGVRDSLLDELYSGEWGVEEDKVRTVVQSRRGESKYVQEEVRHQADLVWFVINALDGRVFVCGSGKGMGEGVEAALVDVAMAKGNLNQEEAKLFWENKKEAGQYIAVSFPLFKFG
ncbi:FAD binding domain protein [Aspergillus clavatus NRRL 1]|uniref:FAD binding domain protein n=1 Tax=Aspergillus clavatus (strain ATCC 1007 / CBS 513.65 / DSM 816 / NCTC 3887 / NRRL 1 / QM 1276 / 107) TaxID=344612 RepID=A1CHV5_ASPCL|nr:FAD binding domain protein [Aspergillus clavatus NRRL 1]EAW10460.1 FAD binding domain protein [Aspergillus clavatus NRRL 1]